MNPHQLKRLFPHASKSVLAANSGDYGPNAPVSPEDTRQAAVPEPVDRKSQLDSAPKAQEAGSGRLHLKFISVRKSLCDPDNLLPKWTIDALRYAGIIRDDTAKEITLETTQRKAAKGEEEFTLLEVYEDSNHDRIGPAPSRP